MQSVVVNFTFLTMSVGPNFTLPVAIHCFRFNYCRFQSDTPKDLTVAHSKTNVLNDRGF